MADAAEQTPPAEGEGKPKNPLIPVVLALVVGLVIGGGAGMFAVGPALAAGIAPTAAVAKHAADGEEAAEGDDAAADEGEEGEEEPKKEGEGAETPAAHVIENIVLNPAGSDGTRFLLLTVAFETKTPEVTEELKARDAEVRDLVLSKVGVRTTEQLATMDVREALKQELADAVTATLFAKHKNKAFRKKPIKRVYFPQYVIQ